MVIDIQTKKIEQMKKLIRVLPVLIIAFLMTSCTSVRVASDYDRNANFNTYKTFAFFKNGIDKAEISDLDKRRILRAIEAELLAKGFTKSEDPDLLVSIFTIMVGGIMVMVGVGALGIGIIIEALQFRHQQKANCL